MGLAIWYLACLVLGAAVGLHSGFYGGIGLLIVGTAFYFASPKRMRAVVTERHALFGGVLAFAVSAAVLPVLLALGVLAP